MVTKCPHCGQKVRIGDPGKYRCPSCREIFETEAGQGAGDEYPESGALYVEVPAFESSLPQDNSDLYVDQTELETACENCGRPGSQQVCRSCGKFVCTDCVGRQLDEGLCPQCINDSKNGLLSAEAGADAGISAPGFIESFVPRLKGVLMSPGRFFSQPITGESPSHPYLFAVICYCVGGVFAVAYSIVMQRTLIDFVDTLNFGLFSSMNLESLMGNPGELFLQTTMILPIQALAGLFFVSGIVHLALVIFGRPGKPFGDTIRIVAYSNATHLLQVIPFLGGVAAFVWQMVIVIIGTSKVHGMDSNRTAIAVLLPFGLLMVLGILLAIGLVAFSKTVGG